MVHVLLRSRDPASLHPHDENSSQPTP
jgi:hypothetical protein